MSQPNLDHGSYIPSLNTVTEELSKICDAIEAHFVTVGASLNEALRAAPWLPNAVKPSPRSPTPGHAMRAVPAPPAPPAGYYEVCKSWASQHRAVTAAVVAFVGTGVLVLWRRRRSSRRHLHRHARVQVVVLAGSPQSPLTRSLALDLQRRGFTVYIVINDVGEERLMQDLWRDHIRPLTLDITSVRPSIVIVSSRSFAAAKLFPFLAFIDDLYPRKFYDLLIHARCDSQVQTSAGLSDYPPCLPCSYRFDCRSRSACVVGHFHDPPRCPLYHHTCLLLSAFGP